MSKTTIITFLLVALCLGAFAKESVEELQQQVKRNEQSGDMLNLSESLNMLGYALWEAQSYEKAIEVFNRSIAINMKMGNQHAAMVILTNIGLAYADLGQYETALLSFRKSMNIRRDLNDKTLVASGLLNIANVLQKLQRYQESVDNASQALELSKELNEVKLMKKCYSVLAEGYQKMGDSKKSMEYFSLYASVQSLIQKQETSEQQKKSQEMVSAAKGEVKKIEQEKSKREKELRLASQTLSETKWLTMKQKRALSTKEQLLNQQKAVIIQRNVFLVYSIIALSLLFIVALLIFVGYRMKRRSSLVLEQQNKEIVEQQEIIKKKNLDIMKSINYAQRIQHSMLPTIEELRQYLPESFVYFRPRDVVSGDFYWFTPTSNKSFVFTNNTHEVDPEEEILLAAVDCTGHGVPGAFMSMIGFNLLDEIVSVGVADPNEILDSLNLGIKNLLNQEHTDNKDGMDIAMCRINKQLKTVYFSGAKNPLVYVKNGQLFEVKGDKFPIGGQIIRSRQPFALQSVSYDDAPVMFYIFSDGYQDQFGGKDGFKFMSKRFRELLLSISDKPAEEQADILEKTRSEWMGNEHKPIDDALVIGFRLA